MIAKPRIIYFQFSCFCVPVLKIHSPNETMKIPTKHIYSFARDHHDAKIPHPCQKGYEGIFWLFLPTVLIFPFSVDTFEPLLIQI